MKSRNFSSRQLRDEESERPSCGNFCAKVTVVLGKEAVLLGWSISKSFSNVSQKGNFLISFSRVAI